MVSGTIKQSVASVNVAISGGTNVSFAGGLAGRNDQAGTALIEDSYAVGSVTGGTKVLSDRILVRVTAGAGESFLDRMIALVEGAKRQKTPNEIALTVLLVVMTIVFLLACVTLLPYSI